MEINSKSDQCKVYEGSELEDVGWGYWGKDDGQCEFKGTWKKPSDWALLQGSSWRKGGGLVQSMWVKAMMVEPTEIVELISWELIDSDK